MIKQSQGTGTRTERKHNSLCEGEMSGKRNCRNYCNQAKGKRKATSRFFDASFENQGRGDNSAPWLLLIAIVDETRR